MVWFQCEACGENLKKPKLPNHFRICSSYKLSCIDCGQVFDKQSVQGHTQCITEAEKYGPKGQAANATPAKPNKDKPKPDVDINVGLSERPPWFCSLCNTSATSKQALLLHADGKKHRAKSRAYAANLTKPSGESLPTNKDSVENISKKESPDDKKENCPSNGALVLDNSAPENGNGNVTSKKRIADASKHDDSSKKAKHELGEGDCKKDKHETGKKGNVGREEDSGQKKIKWKKLITSALKSTPEGALKIKKLQKLVLNSLVESGIKVDDVEFKTTLQHKVNLSSKFTIDGKHVRLAI